MKTNNEERNVVRHNMFGLSPIDIIVEDGTTWLTVKQIAEGFETTVRNIRKHFDNIFQSKELDEDSSRKEKYLLADDNKMRNMMCYNLDAIISVGYRVDSKTATLFRKEATKVLSELSTKGFVVNKRLASEGKLEEEALLELTKLIRSFRSSEASVHATFKRIFLLCTDYDLLTQEEKRTLFSSVQNKLHYAVIGKVAAEIVYEGVDIDKPHMGLQSWKNGPEGNITKEDVTLGKNYLGKEELKRLENFIFGFLIIMDDDINGYKLDKKKLHTGEILKAIDDYTVYRRRKVFDPDSNIVTVTRKTADEKAHGVYRIYKKQLKENTVREIK